MQHIRLTSVLLCILLLLAACSPIIGLGVGPLPETEEDLLLADELLLAYLADGAEDMDGGLPPPQAVSFSLSESITLLSTGDASLRIPETFAVTRPDSKLTTTYESYFITGTSDPSLPVYFGNEEIERMGSMGTFGVHVELAMGENTFALRQGDNTQTVTIVRSAPAGTAPISEIVQTSMVPSIQAGVKAGEKLSVGCIAPSGASVTATYGGKSVELKQTSADVKAGYPATFTGKIAIAGDWDPDVTEKGEQVRYELSYSGSAKSFTSTGYVYVAGENSDIAIEITNYLGFVYPDTKDLSTFKETVKAGARDYVASQTNDYFELSSGGFIPKGQVKILTGKVGVVNKLDSVAFQTGDRGESLVFAGTRSPLYNTWISDDTFYLRLYNTSGTPDIKISGSSLASSASLKEEDGAVVCALPLKGLVWGYDVAFDAKSTVLTLSYKPALSDASAPLSGITVLVDPGHGGTDPGALGLAGSTGPTEADVNLANALATRDLLAQMGANVVMTRTDDSYVSLDERLEMIETNKADFFVSLHHNSLAESTDANKVSGMEVYYHTALSKRFADTMMSSLATGLNRNNRKVEQSYYRVTLMPYAPALLLELGFMTNPLEYEKAVTQGEMQKVASAVCDGVIAALC